VICLDTYAAGYEAPQCLEYGGKDIGEAESKRERSRRLLMLFASDLLSDVCPSEWSGEVG
jgi:hypothetical protein